MLLELLVENYAVVEKQRIRFHAGLNVLTGETGSGKSIVVDALALLFGSRTSTDMLRSGAERARVSGLFDAPRAAVTLLEAAGIAIEDCELLIEREILAGGKSRAYVCNRPVTAVLLRELAPLLADIHGQHEQQRLFSADAQLDILDDFADNSALLVQVADVYRRWRACATELEEISRTEQENLRLLDLWSFQRNEIEAARLKPGEDDGLETERKIQQNVGRLLDTANTAYAVLYDAPDSVTSQIGIAVKKIEELCRIDHSLEPLLETLRPAQVAVDDASATLRDYAGDLESDPDRLEEIESRLATIDKLKRKYGSSIEQILSFLEDVRTKIQAVESTAERRAAIKHQQTELAKEFTGLANQLTSRRAAGAALLAKRVQSELKSLAMEGTVFQAQLEAARWSETGADSITFLVSANIGEELRRLEKVASGGELSRIALALKTCVTGGSKSRTLVFDEVDAGIGGTAADSVGRRLKSLSAENQVLCVTHLAQIAGFADHHFAVEKKEQKGRTVAIVTELIGDARTREIGRMLSGQRLTPEALKHAEQLIRTSAAD